MPADAPPLEGPLHLEKVGEKTLAQSSGGIGADGVGSVSIEYGAGPTMAEVAILPEGSKIGPALWVREGTWLSGVVQQAFEACDQPLEERYGFLNLKKRVVCEALASIK